MIMKESKENSKANPLATRDPLFNKSSLFHRLVIAETPNPAAGVGFSTSAVGVSAGTGDPAWLFLVGSSGFDMWESNLEIWGFESLLPENKMNKKGQRRTEKCGDFSRNRNETGDWETLFPATDNSALSCLSREVFQVRPLCFDILTRVARFLTYYDVARKDSSNLLCQNQLKFEDILFFFCSNNSKLSIYLKLCLVILEKQVHIKGSFHCKWNILNLFCKRSLALGSIQ